MVMSSVSEMIVCEKSHAVINLFSILILKSNIQVTLLFSFFVFFQSNMLRTIALQAISRSLSLTKKIQLSKQPISNSSSLIFWRRSVSSSTVSFSESASSGGSNDRNIQVNYITKKGEKITLYGKEGDNVMYLAQQNSVDIEGACEASLACCTCHVYVRDDYYDRLTPAIEEEEDMLDMAPFLKSNSRLSKHSFFQK